MRDEVAEDIEGQLPPTIAAVMPQGGSFAQFGAGDANAVILEALHTVPGWSAVKPRRVVFGAYSGGGGTAAGLLGSGKDKAADRQAERMKDLKGLSEVVLFDAINGPKSELPAAISFVNDQIGVDIGRLGAESDADKQKEHLKFSMRFRGFFTAASPTTTRSTPRCSSRPCARRGCGAGRRTRRSTERCRRRSQTRSRAGVGAARRQLSDRPRGQGHETKLPGGNLKEAMDALTPGAAPTYPT